MRAVVYSGYGVTPVLTEVADPACPDDGVMIADSVGLGKTWIGKKLLEDFAYHMR